MESSNISSILNEQLNGNNKTTRTALSNLMKDDIFTPVYDISLREMKELAFKRLKSVITNKVVSIRDFLKDPDNIFTVHEMVNIV
jgi:hypothetical protein